jgi:hypothetical protein
MGAVFPPQRLFKPSTNTNSSTDAKYSNDMKNKEQLRSAGVLVTVQFRLVSFDYSDEFEITSMLNTYLVN